VSCYSSHYECVVIQDAAKHLTSTDSSQRTIGKYYELTQEVSACGKEHGSPCGTWHFADPRTGHDVKFQHTVTNTNPCGKNNFLGFFFNISKRCLEYDVGPIHSTEGPPVPAAPHQHCSDLRGSPVAPGSIFRWQCERSSANDVNAVHHLHVVL
jgi:hypothetical protein